ncbi:hypothetical protein KPH14_006676 [Odynerus spinipes]|uniref:Uncharacterized protein n=1 Tax=Odynerus spinipes TaxID=1348599 RepID=A0AAD9VSB6_9HYME|nr:hypothetical protein KPH14_006676 [Odynerus spinipes]
MVFTWQNDYCKQYRLKLKQATSAIDMSPPKSRSHVTFNAKRAQLERERQARILKDNFILLKKLSAIMYRKRTKDVYQRLHWTEPRCIRAQ